MASLSLLASHESLPDALAFLRSQACSAALPESSLARLDVVIEELFLNIALYSYDNLDPGPVQLTCTCPASGTLVVEIADQGLAFNPLISEPPKLDHSIEERKSGGLGIYIAKQWTSSIEYLRTDGWNRLTLTISTGSPGSD